MVEACSLLVLVAPLGSVHACCSPPTSGKSCSTDKVGCLFKCVEQYSSEHIRETCTTAKPTSDALEVSAAEVLAVQGLTRSGSLLGSGQANDTFAGRATCDAVAPRSARFDIGHSVSLGWPQQYIWACA